MVLLCRLSVRCRCRRGARGWRWCWGRARSGCWCWCWGRARSGCWAWRLRLGCRMRLGLRRTCDRGGGGKCRMHRCCSGWVRLWLWLWHGLMRRRSGTATHARPTSGRGNMARLQRGSGARCRVLRHSSGRMRLWHGLMRRHSGTATHARPTNGRGKMARLRRGGRRAMHGHRRQSALWRRARRIRMRRRSTHSTRMRQRRRCRGSRSRRMVLEGRARRGMRAPGNRSDARTRGGLEGGELRGTHRLGHAMQALRTLHRPGWGHRGRVRVFVVAGRCVVAPAMRHVHPLQVTVRCRIGRAIGLMRAKRNPTHGRANAQPDGHPHTRANKRHHRR